MARDAFQHKLDIVYNSLDFCKGIVDYMIIWGGRLTGDHDDHLTKLPQVTRQHSLKLNLDKLKFKTKQVSFFGTTFISDGHKPENKKVHTISKMSQLTIFKDLQCSLCMVNYLNGYSPHFTELGDSFVSTPRRIHPLNEAIHTCKHLKTSSNYQCPHLEALWLKQAFHLTN